MRNKKRLMIDPFAKPSGRLSEEWIADLPDPVEIGGYNITHPPPVPKACSELYSKTERQEHYNNPVFYSSVCKMCSYNKRNQATLFEFGRLVDACDFNCRSFVGVLGTDTRVQCDIIPDKLAKSAQPAKSNKMGINRGNGAFRSNSSVVDIEDFTVPH